MHSLLIHCVFGKVTTHFKHIPYFREYHLHQRTSATQTRPMAVRQGAHTAQLTIVFLLGEEHLTTTFQNQGGGSPHQTPLQHLSASTTTTTTLPCGGPAGEGLKACHQHPRRGDAAKNTSKSYLPEGVAGDTRCTASPLNHCRRG